MRLVEFDQAWSQTSVHYSSSNTPSWRAHLNRRKSIIDWNVKSSSPPLASPHLPVFIAVTHACVHACTRCVQYTHTKTHSHVTLLISPKLQWEGWQASGKYEKAWKSRADVSWQGGRDGSGLGAKGVSENQQDWTAILLLDCFLMLLKGVMPEKTFFVEGIQLICQTHTGLSLAPDRYLNTCSNRAPTEDFYLWPLRFVEWIIVGYVGAKRRMKLEFKVRWLKASFIHSKSEKILSVEQWFSNSVMSPLKDRIPPAPRPTPPWMKIL